MARGPGTATKSRRPAYCAHAEGAVAYSMTEEILINVTPQETRVAVIEHGVTHELHIERTSARGLVGNIYMGRVVRVLPGMQSAFIDIGGERAAFLHVADIWGSRTTAARAGTPIERAPARRRPEPRGAGRERPDRHQRRAALHADQHRRALPRLSAAGIAHRHLAAHRGRGRAPAPAREAAAAPAAGGERRLHHPHDGRDRLGPRAPLRRRIPAQALARHPGARADAQRR